MVAHLVDTSTWSLAYRRNAPADVPAVRELTRALLSGESVFSTGVILLELLRGDLPPRTRSTITREFAALDFVEPRTQDYVAAAELSNTCRRRGVQLGTVDALIAQLAIANDLTLLTTDKDFEHAAMHVPLRIWS